MGSGKLDATVDLGRSTVIILNLPTSDNVDLDLKKVKCCDKEVETVIDTCAVISVISPTFCKILKLILSKWVAPNLSVAGNTLVTPAAGVNINLQIDQISFNVQAAVVDLNGFSLLLGNNALSYLRSIRIDTP